MRGLESSFDVLACADLLRWLSDAGKTGGLRVSHGAAVRRIYFASGRIVACTTNESRLALGPYLLAHGWVDEATMQRSAKSAESSGRSLASVLVERGAISQADLQGIGAARAEEMIFGLFDWPTGNFRFEPDQAPPSDVLGIDMTVEATLLAGARRLEELERIRKVFHSPQAVVQKSRAVPPSAVESPLEQRLLEAVDGRRTLGEIARVCGASEHTAGLFLTRQAELGRVRLKDVEAAALDVVDGGTTLHGLRELLATGEYEAAVDWIERCQIKPDGDDFVTMLIARAEAGFLSAAYRTLTPPDAVPRRVRPDAPPGRESEVLSSDDLLLLDLVDGRWDVRSLGWIAPIRKIDVVRGLMRLQRHGCIELRSPRSEYSPARPAGGEDAVADIERAVGELGV